MGTLIIRRTFTSGDPPTSWVSVVDDSQRIIVPQMKQLGLSYDGRARPAITTEVLAYYPALGPATVWDTWEDIEESYDDR